MQNINYSAGLPMLPITGRSAINLDTWISDLKGNFDSIMKRLFANGEQGAYYDPNDLTDEKLNWHKNLCTESEFRNGVVDAPSRGGDVVVTTFTGLTDGAGIQLNSNASISAYAYKSVPTVVGQVYTFSCFIRMLDGTRPNVGGASSANDVTLVFDTTVIPNDKLTIQQISASLYRVSGYGIATRATASVGAVKYLNHSVRPVVVSGYQCEQGALVSSYQRITDFNTEFLKAFPSHNMYQDIYGIVPVTALTQPLGLVLDKSKNLALGGELTVNGHFDIDTTGWINFGLAQKEVIDGVLYLTAQPSETFPTGISQDINFNIHQTVKVVVRAKLISGSTPANICVIPRTNSYSLPNTVQRVISNQFNDYIFYVTKEQAALGVRVYLQMHTGNSVLAVDSVSVKEIAGNHAYQSTSAKRPMISARVNRFNDDKNIPWQEANFAEVNASNRYVQRNAFIAPDNTQTADRVVVSNGSNALQRIFSVVPVPNSDGLIFTYSIYAKANKGKKISIKTSGGAHADNVFNLETGQWLTTGNATNRSSTYIKDGWWRLSITYTHPNNAVVPWVVIPSPESSHSTTWVGDGITDVLIWGAQVEYGEYLSKFQWIKSATDYDTKDFARYFETDGVDDSLHTPPFAMSSSFSLVFPIKTLKAISTQALFSAGGSGYFYIAGGNLFGTQQNTGNPQVNITRNSTDVLLNRTDSNGSFFKSNKASALRTDLVDKDPYRFNTSKTIGNFTDSSATTVSCIQLYGLIAIGRPLTDAEEKAIRDEFNKRISYV